MGRPIRVLKPVASATPGPPPGRTREASWSRCWSSSFLTCRHTLHVEWRVSLHRRWTLNVFPAQPSPGNVRRLFSLIVRHSWEQGSLFWYFLLSVSQPACSANWTHALDALVCCPCRVLFDYAFAVSDLFLMQNQRGAKTNVWVLLPGFLFSPSLSEYCFRGGLFKETKRLLRTFPQLINVSNFNKGHIYCQ